VLDVASGAGYLLTAGSDNTVRIWDKPSLDSVATLEGHSGPPHSIAVDSSRIYTGATDGSVMIWDLDNFEEIDRIDAQEHFVLTVEVDDNFIYAGGLDNCTHVFDKKTCDYVVTLEGHDATVFAVKADEGYVYTCSGEIWWGGPGSPRPSKFESAIRVWDKQDWTCIKRLDGHSDNVNTLALDRHYVYSVSDDRTLRIYLKDSWKQHVVAHLDALRVKGLAVDSTHVYVGGSDLIVRCILKDDLLEYEE
jgi:WD40 repeat protein